MLAGAFLVGLSTVQAEFDFSVPQFRLLYHPVLLMLAASIALVTARIWIGRGGALLTLGGYLIVRGLLTGLVGGVWGQTTPHFPLYAAEACASRPSRAGHHPPADGVRRGGGRGDRHHRPGRRVGLVARVDGRCPGPRRCCPKASSSASWPRSRAA